MWQHSKATIVQFYKNKEKKITAVFQEWTLPPHCYNFHSYCQESRVHTRPTGSHFTVWRLRLHITNVISVVGKWQRQQFLRSTNTDILNDQDKKNTVNNFSQAQTLMEHRKTASNKLVPKHTTLNCCMINKATPLQTCLGQSNSPMDTYLSRSLI